MLLQHGDLDPGTGEQEAEHEARRASADDAAGRMPRIHHAMNYALGREAQSATDAKNFLSSGAQSLTWWPSSR